MLEDKLIPKEGDDVKITTYYLVIILLNWNISEVGVFGSINRDILWSNEALLE